MTDLPPTRRTVTTTRVLSVRAGAGLERSDDVVTEEPMEIRLAGPRGGAPVSVAVTMRTPGHDFDLAVGFLHSEGLVSPGDVSTVRYCELPEAAEQRFNIVTVRLRRAIAPDMIRARRFDVSASCGICGKTSLDELADRCPTVLPGPKVAGSVLPGLAAKLSSEQRVFATTGGLHAAGLFRADGELVVAREDIGRHNAVDKVIGHALLAGLLPLTGHLLMVSGRVSFEIVEKAAMAGIGLVAAVSAPSSLAIDAARRFGVTLVGFVRDDRYNVYSGADRLEAGAGA
ncbi:MAG TPA: formate dehydrogenase accessory sulfurtransferase FdhD [Acidimicrobiales bacterium]|nr:formate dehydrogenase accessory sulfurtransferase FdhD [Acidimicrobiales bacterium]